MVRMIYVIAVVIGENAVASVLTHKKPVEEPHVVIAAVNVFS